MHEQYQTLAKLLLDEIKAGAYLADTPLPRRNELARKHKMARSTVDRAIRLLVERGTLVSRRGDGTYIASVTAKHHLAVVGAGEDCKPFFAHPRCLITFIPAKDMETASGRSQLASHDGTLWFFPCDAAREWIASLKDTSCHAVINRDWADCNHIATDQRAATYLVTQRRLAENPGILPVYLRVPQQSTIINRRQEGFVAACREAGVFYEGLDMPGDFQADIEALESCLGKRKGALLVSDSLCHTGAVMAWARGKGIKWRQGWFYSDFDNNLPQHIFGLKATTFIQDIPGMISQALASMSDLLEKGCDSFQTVLSPAFVEGGT